MTYSKNRILGERWAATLVDMLLFLVFALLMASLFSSSALTFLLLGVGILAYYIVMEGRWGATLGKLATKIRVVDALARPPGFAKASVRTLLRLIEVNPIVAGGLPAGIVALFSPTKQRLGDMLAGTYVLYATDAARLTSGPPEKEMSRITTG